MHPNTQFTSLLNLSDLSPRYAEQLSAIPQFAHLGPLFKSSVPVELTEAETEYMVRCIKHTFQNHIVLQVRDVEGKVYGQDSVWCGGVSC